MLKRRYRHVVNGAGPSIGRLDPELLSAGRPAADSQRNAAQHRLAFRAKRERQSKKICDQPIPSAPKILLLFHFPLLFLPIATKILD